MDDRAIPAPPLSRARSLLKAALAGPIPNLRHRHIPILGTYFGYGALGFTGVAESLWVKGHAELLTPAALAQLGVLAGLPWSVKVIFGQMVDSFALGGSSRRGWLLLGSALIAAGLLLQAATAHGLILAGVLVQYIIGTLLVATGVALQDVVADALTSEIVPRVEADGSARPRQAIIQEMAMVQVLGRFTLLLSVALVAGIAEWAAANVSTAGVYLIGLFVPCLTAAAAVSGEVPEVKQTPVDWAMLAGGTVIAAILLAGVTGHVATSQEVVFAVSLIIVAWLFLRISRELDADLRRTALSFAVIAFAIRSQPALGEPLRWYTIDVLGLDQPFLSRLGQISSTVGLVGLWVMSQVISRNKQTRVLLWLVLAAPVLELPTLATVFGLHHWTEANFGIGAREILHLDVSFQLRVTNLTMIAMLTLAAFYAPEGRRATWFTLMATLFNLGLSAGALLGTYLNWLFPVTRGNYELLPTQVIAAMVVGTLVPGLAVLLLGRRMA